MSVFEMLDTYIHEFLILFVCKWIKWLKPPLNEVLAVMPWQWEEQCFKYAVQ